MTDEDFQAGRDLLAAGRLPLALEHFAVAADAAAVPAERAAALAFAAEIALLLGRPHEALDWADRLRAEGGNPDQAALLSASARVALGEGGAALALLATAVHPDTPWSRYSPASRHVLASQALALEGRVDEAVAAVRDALVADPRDAWAWRHLATLAEDPSVDPRPVLDAVPPGRFAETAGALVTASPAGTDRVLEALWAARPGDPRVLALLAYVGPRLGIARALVWSGRIRAAGAPQHCPLLGLAADPDGPARERVEAAALAAAVFGDDRAPAVLEAAAVAVPDADLEPALDRLAGLAPDLVPGFLEVAAGEAPHRALALAVLLRRRDQPGAAVALVRHALRLAGGDAGSLGRHGTPAAELRALADAARPGDAVLGDALAAAAQAAERRAVAI